MISNLIFRLYVISEKNSVISQLNLDMQMQSYINAQHVKPQNAGNHLVANKQIKSNALTMGVHRTCFCKDMLVL